jgi:hypothetical protein
VLPGIAPRVKERSHFFGCGIDTRQVGALSEVAPVASQGEVLDGIEAAMLFGNDVLDAMGEVAAILRKPTVLATMARALPDIIPRRAVDG